MSSTEKDVPVLRPNGKVYRRRKPPVLSLAYDEWNGIPVIEWDEPRRQTRPTSPEAQS